MNKLEDTKKCLKCGEEKILNDFYRRKNGSVDGFRNECKLCFSEEKKKKYQLNRESILKEKREYYLKNKGKIKEYVFKYREKNREKINQYVREYGKKLRAEKPELHNNRVNKYMTKKRKENPIYKLKYNIRCRISVILKKNDIKKPEKTIELVGCDFFVLKKHLENKFENGMNWENYGEWHVDHIIPISLAKNEEDIKRLSHYTNLQPLWGIDNIKKRDKV